MLRALKFALTRLLFAFFRKVILLLKLMASVGGRVAESTTRRGATSRAQCARQSDEKQN